MVVQLLKDTGADLNLVSSLLVARNKHLFTGPWKPVALPRRLALRGVGGKTGHYITHKVRLPLRLGDHFSEEWFAIAPLDLRQEIILGLPWLEKFLPEVVCELRSFGSVSQTEQMSGQSLENDPAGNVLSLPAIADLPKSDGPTESLPLPGADPGVRGLTGNSENWLETIPERFRRFAHTVFSDEAAAALPPFRPGLDCEIKVREGEKLSTSKIYDMSQEQLTTLKALLDVELAKGFIRPSQSSSSAPVFFVTDPPSESRNKGQLRLVVDYRDLNRKIELDEYPIPLTRTVMARLPKAKIFTKFDVRSGFSNIRVAPGSEPATAFKTFFGLFEYQVMPMGLATAPSVFQRFINHVLAPFLDLFCFAYLDDIIIFSENEEEHARHVEQILEALEGNSLHLKPSKCVWGVQEVSFLGYTAVAGKGIRMSDDKIAKITELASPRNVHEVREVLGLINFYGGFIPHYSDICAPINRLTGKDVPWDWSPECESAFRRLLDSVRNDVFLAAFDWDLPITLETDASDVAYGGVISQPGPDGRLRPVVMFHHKFSSHEKNWDIHDKELYAIVYAFDNFRHFLSAPRYPVSVISDHRNLSKFMFSTDLLKSHDGRLGRWWQILSGANFTIEYRTGNENVVADFLSRYQQNASPPSGHVLLPEHRFSRKSLADISVWFKRGNGVGLG